MPYKKVYEKPGFKFKDYDFGDKNKQEEYAIIEERLRKEPQKDSQGKRER